MRVCASYVQFSCVLGVLLLAELTLCVLAFVFSSDVKRRVVEILQMQALVHYRDDDDLRNLVDWTQHTVSAGSSMRCTVAGA